MTRHDPPRLLTALLSRLIPAEEREYFIGDLTELYRERSEAGRSRATRWYLSQVGRSALRMMGRGGSGTVVTPIDGRTSGGTVRMIRDMMQDFGYAVRGLRRAPGFAAVAILTLAIGIGANSALFSVLDSVILRPLPFDQPDRLMRLYLRMPQAGVGGDGTIEMSWSYPKLETLDELQRHYEATAAFDARQITLWTEAGAERIFGEVVDADYHRILGIEPILGRTFGPEEAGIASESSAVLLSHAFWTNRMGGSRDVLTESLRLNGTEYPIAGVMPSGFRGLTGTAEFWLPISVVGQGTLSNSAAHSLDVVARLAEGVTEQQAKSGMAELGRRIDESHPSQSIPQAWGAEARTLDEVRVDPSIRRALGLLFGAVGFVLLIACANLANLVLVRAMSREREMAVRLSIGASRGRLVRQMLVESMTLALFGGVLGLLLTVPAISIFRRMAPQASNAFAQDVSGLTQVGFETIGMNGTVLLFTVAITLATGVLFGLIPALRRETDSGVALRQSATPSGGGSGSNGAASFGLRDALVLGEVALVFVLLVGSGLMMRSLSALLDQDLGFSADRTVTARLSYPSGKYEGEELKQLVRGIEDEMRAIPGVEAAGFHYQCAPMSGGCDGAGVLFPNDPALDAAGSYGSGVHFVSTGYFEVLEIPMVSGRAFNSQDLPESGNVVILNLRAAETFWGDEDPIGKQIASGYEGAEVVRTVVGVAPDIPYEALDLRAQPDLYMPMEQSPFVGRVLYVKGTTSTDVLVNEVRNRIRAVDAEIIVTDAGPVQDLIHTASSGTRFSTMVLSLYAVLAFALAALGIYGVLSNTVALRTREIAIRMAIGAEERSILKLIANRGFVLIVGGMVMGLALSIVLVRLLRSLLYEVQPGDPMTFVAAIGLLSILGLLASVAPARRAMRVDPIGALKGD